MVYIVTKESDDGTFGVGDRIFFHPDGSIIDYTAEGWIEAEQVEECTKGMEIELDKTWIKRRKMQLLSQLAELEKNEVSSIDKA